MEEKHRDRTLLQDTDQTAQPRADKAREREKGVGREESDPGGAESNVGPKYLSPDEDGGKNQDEPPEIPDQARSALPQTTKSRSTVLAWEGEQRSHDDILTQEDNSGAKTALSQQEIPPPRRRRRQQLRQQHDEQPEPKKGNDNSALRLRLDLNLDIEIELKAKIHGDITLTLL
ncbi:hypothetical protein T069G_08966 [Trichoderma breve]|uniref:Uncharacterized protein n=1 Tax=Trichoderma breve TaxID=2034170 RepID=A0A9W9B8Y0_9HYPO|nr:hypothetical protein T069G_08966 [Trichoderma breve]KAJ4855598.1 hypothetical protein T069G_08966 [Trichoderma breve]